MKLSANIFSHNDIFDGRDRKIMMHCDCDCRSRAYNLDVINADFVSFCWFFLLFSFPLFSFLLFSCCSGFDCLCELCFYAHFFSCLTLLLCKCIWGRPMQLLSLQHAHQSKWHCCTFCSPVVAHLSAYSCASCVDKQCHHCIVREANSSSQY